MPVVDLRSISEPHSVSMNMVEWYEVEANRALQLREKNDSHKETKAMSQKRMQAIPV